MTEAKKIKSTVFTQSGAIDSLYDHAHEAIDNSIPVRNQSYKLINYTATHKKLLHEAEKESDELLQQEKAFLQFLLSLEKRISKEDYFQLVSLGLQATVARLKHIRKSILHIDPDSVSERDQLLLSVVDILLKNFKDVAQKLEDEPAMVGDENVRLYAKKTLSLMKETVRMIIVEDADLQRLQDKVLSIHKTFGDVRFPLP